MLKKIHLLFRFKTQNKHLHQLLWQRDWDAEGVNKLHEVLPNLGKDLHRRGEGAGRKLETAVCRLRVGHTWLTQSYLLKNEQPFCYACDSLYTVRHILIECPDFQDTRRKYFGVTDLYRLFREKGGENNGSTGVSSITTTNVLRTTRCEQWTADYLCNCRRRISIEKGMKIHRTKMKCVDNSKDQQQGSAQSDRCWKTKARYKTTALRKSTLLIQM
ncbi:ribonuclease hi [Plakobranchus ocellatus]|uniref:Ribonuclease hi n=1 Tax=Plakobranchus ocellatus TaxID=259542 RepID=A0AAV3Z2N4_9GAST|nr:ribonuclease hi [Plakobranchus ocellatus]